MRDLLKIQAGEEKLVILVTGIMLAVYMGAAIGSPGVEGLFLTRFGVEFLPQMYILLGVVTFLASLVITILLARVDRRRLYVLLPLAMAAFLIGARLFLTLELIWFYPILWLGMMVMWTLQGLFSWGIAGAICNTRQAKRLFPLFGAGGILGVSLGGLATQPLVRWLQAENLLVIWALALFAAFILGRLLVGMHADSPAIQPIGAAVSNQLFSQFQQGFQFVRNSELLRWLAGGVVLFAMLFFSLSFPFAKAAANRFPDENQLSGFLGVFQGATTALAFLASLFLANRLYARFGITNMVLAYTGVYLVGFAGLAMFASFASLVVVRFFQVFWYQGIANSAYQAIFNAIPADRRDQTRTFMDGVLGQIGIILAGLTLLLGERVLPDQLRFLFSSAVALAAFFAIWQASHAYRGALVEALRAGQPQFFFSEEEPFGGFQRDAAAVAAVVEGVSHPDPVVRRVSAEVLGNLSVPEARDALVQALEDEDAQVRAAIIRSLARAEAAPALLEVLNCLRDPAAMVRVETVKALRVLAAYPRGVIAQIEPLLEDAEAGVQAATAVTLLRFGQHKGAYSTLEAMVAAPQADTRLQVLSAVADWGSPAAYPLVVDAVEDPIPVVRRAALDALASTNPERGLDTLAKALGDEDPYVRSAVGVALGKVGHAALVPTLAALDEPVREEGALLALENLDVSSETQRIRRYAQSRIDLALHYHSQGRQVAALDGGDRLNLLRVSLERVARRHGTHALRALGLLTNRTSISVALDHLGSHNSNLQANALEILETIEAAALVRPLLALWEQAEPESEPADSWLAVLLCDADAWIRACAVLVAGERGEPGIRVILADLAETDPDPVVREAAASALISGDEENMETLPTLSIMERILFLRRVPLFSDLPPADLKRVASIARESLFSDGTVIVNQGDAGEEMFILVSGEVSVLMAKGQGKPIEVARRTTGEYVGEMAIISHEPRMASLVAVGPVRTLGIGLKEFESLLRERPETSLSVMRVLCQRLREQPEHITRVQDHSDGAAVGEGEAQA